MIKEIRVKNLSLYIAVGACGICANMWAVSAFFAESFGKSVVAVGIATFLMILYFIMLRWEK